MRKECPEHGVFEDILSIDPEFSRLIEARHPGRDVPTCGDGHLHRHGASNIRYGRGAVMTIDLTNRCNMMCDPCFIDANQVGYVHELTMDDIRAILDASMSFKPRRQMSVQFSGGEPTISPHFLDACRYAHEVGYYQVQAATNGLRFAQEPEFAFRAKEAGFDMAYLQFDGVTNEADAHRKVTNLFDAKLLAIENMYAAGINIVPVTTVVNTINDDQVGAILEFIIRHSEKFGGISFQPVSFTGRDEDISDEDRAKRRYTLSHLAHDLANHFDGRIDPYRDWFPLGAMTWFTSLADHLRGPAADFGGLCCSCHPDCGASTMLVVNHKTGAWAPITSFFDVDWFVQDIDVIVDSARGQKLSVTQTALSMLRNFDPRKAPAGMDFATFIGLFNRKLNGALRGGRKADLDAWKMQWVGGMWFQDLWTYDFRRTEMCVIPYGTQEGEISFCAYNTGMGWRQIVESMHMAASTKDWFKARGRHPVYAGNRPMPLPRKPKLFLEVLAGDGNGNAGMRACGKDVQTPPHPQLGPEEARWEEGSARG